MTNSRISPSTAYTLMIWYRSLLTALFAAVLSFIFIYSGWLAIGVAVAIFFLFMAWWMSPLHRGQHQALETATKELGSGKGVIIWAPTSKRSSQLQTGILASDSKFIWVNFFNDQQAQAFAIKLAQEKHNGAGKIEAYRLLPIVILQDQVITNATAGAVKDALPK